jgi:ribosomal protein S18 acetylase RimI-like enzyme
VANDRIVLTDTDVGLSSALRERIHEYNVEVTGIADWRWLGAEVRDTAGELMAGLVGWTWGGCGYVEDLWVRADRRRSGLGGRLLASAEAEAMARGCSRMALSTHSFQAPAFYRSRGYVEVGRVDDYYPPGFGEYLFVRELTLGALPPTNP